MREPTTGGNQRMDEQFDKRALLLSALLPGLGQLTSGNTSKGLVMIAADLTLSGASGVLALLLRVLTFGRRPIKALPTRLNLLAVGWLAFYLYNLYDAYNLASGA